MIQAGPLSWMFSFSNKTESKSNLSSLFNQGAIVFDINSPISGMLTIKPLKKGNINFSDLSIKLVLKKSGSENLISDYNLSKNSCIKEEKSFSFCFKEKELLQSFHGKKYCFRYHLDVRFKRTMQKTLHLKQQLIIQDLNYLKDSIESFPITFNSHIENASCILNIPQNHFVLNDFIKGTIKFSTDVQEISEISLILKNHEVFIESSNSETMESILKKFQIISGCPRPNSEIPFLIPIANICIWPSTKQVQSDFYLELEIVSNGKIIFHETKDIYFVFSQKEIHQIPISSPKRDI